MQVLVADDARMVRQLIGKAVKDLGHEVVMAADGTEALELLSAEDHPQLAILAWELRGKTGPEVCEAVRQIDRPGYTYLVILTSHADSEHVAAGFAAGADDYMTKPFNPVELAGRMSVAERMIDLTRQLHEALNQMAALAATDDLTKLANRRAVMDRLDYEVARSLRSHQPIGLVLVDVDHFKSINDTHGHVVGDQVLAKLAGTLRSALRGTDIVGRWGGEEFVALLFDSTLEAAADTAERMREAVREVDFPTLGREVTISAGVAEFVPGGGHEIADVIEAVDLAMYRAKVGGRDRVCVAESGDYAQAAANRILGH